MMHRPVWGLCVAVAILLATSFVHADEIDDAAKLPADEAVPKLESLLEKAEASEDQAAALRIHAWLAGFRLQEGEPYAALQHLEVLARERGGAADKITYGEALIAVARGNLQGNSTAAGIVPYCQDALEALKPCANDTSLSDALRARCLLARGEAYYILRYYDKAVEAFAALDPTRLATPMADRLLDLLARSQYAAGKYLDAAMTFRALGNDLGAAAAYDAAKRPEKSVPIYARALAARPTDAGLLRRAQQGATFAGGEARLLAALEDIAVPEGRAGVPMLLTKADLLEAVSRTQEALAPLQDAAGRDPADPRASARLGRLILLTGDVESDQTWDDAANAYREALRRDPEFEAASAGLYYIAGRDYKLLWNRWRDPRLRDRCLVVQEALVEALPDDPLAWSNLGNTLRILGRTDDALRAYEKAREANPYDPSIRSDQGLALSAAGQDEAALKAFLDSIELDAGHRAGRQNAARSLWLKGEDEAAAKQLGAAIPSARAVGTSPGTYVFLLGRTWRTTRRPDLR